MTAEDDLMAAYQRAEAKGLIPRTADLAARMTAAEDVCVALLEVDAWNPKYRGEYEHDAVELAVLEALERWMVYL